MYTVNYVAIPLKTEGSARFVALNKNTLTKEGREVKKGMNGNSPLPRQKQQPLPPPPTKKRRVDGWCRATSAHVQPTKDLTLVQKCT